MLFPAYTRTPDRRSRERGQAAVFVMLVMGFLLLGVLGLATDYTQIWARRQMVQTAADAACQAGAADLLLRHQNPAAGGSYPLGDGTTLDYSWIGEDYNCSSRPNSPPCRYAALNGYSGSGVSVSFPATIPDHNLTGFGTVTNPYIQVTVVENMQMTFSKLVGQDTFAVRASATCGLEPVAVPIPLVILHPTMSGSFSTQGAPTVTILGGPRRSVQVDSSSSTAVNVGGSSAVNLSQAGPNNNGSDFGVFGSQTTKPSGVNLGTQGNWISPATPYGDPWITVEAPTMPAENGQAIPQPFAYNGCPDPAGCVEFTAGNYSSCSTANSLAPGANGCLMLPYGGSNPRFATPVYPARSANTIYAVGDRVISGSWTHEVVTAGMTAAGAVSFNATWNGTTSDGGVVWRNIGQVNNTPRTAIFRPGVYYVGSTGLAAGSNATLRMSTHVGDDSEGATFYFNTATSLAVGSNSGGQSACTAASPGSATPNNCVVSYRPDGATTLGVTSRPLFCAAGGIGSLPTAIDPTSPIDGNILTGPCSGTYGSGDGVNRGFLFFQNRNVATTASWGGGGCSVSSGFMYFRHNNYGSSLSLAGGSCSNAYTLGNVVTDRITMGGNSGIRMILNPAATFQILRPQLLR